MNGGDCKERVKGCFLPLRSTRMRDEGERGEFQGKGGTREREIRRREEEEGEAFPSKYTPLLCPCLLPCLVFALYTPFPSQYTMPMPLKRFSQEISEIEKDPEIEKAPKVERAVKIEKSLEMDYDKYVCGGGGGWSNGGGFTYVTSNFPFLLL